MNNMWWSEILAVMKGAYDFRDLKILYSTIRQIFGPQSWKNSWDGSGLIKDANVIMAWWNKHPQREFITEMKNDPIIDEIVYCQRDKYRESTRFRWDSCWVGIPVESHFYLWSGVGGTILLLLFMSPFQMLCLKIGKMLLHYLLTKTRASSQNAMTTVAWICLEQ